MDHSLWCCSRNRFHRCIIFCTFFIFYGSMFLTKKSPKINNLFVICFDCCDVFSDLLILLAQFSASDEINILSAGSVLDDYYSADFSADIVGSFAGLLVVSCAMFNSLLFDCSTIAFSRSWNWFLEIYEHHDFKHGV